jgi:hypothetical protein
MLPLNRKEKLDDVKRYPFPYRFAKPAMFSKPRKRLSPRQIYVAAFLFLCLFFWIISRRGSGRNNHFRSPYAVASRHMDDTLPIVDITIQECTRWRWFEKRSKCTALLESGWEISGGDLLLDTGKTRLHLFIKRQRLDGPTPVLTELRISRERPNDDEAWQSRPGGIWMKRRAVRNIKDAITAVDFIHGEDIRELRRGRQFAPGGRLLFGQHINLSFRVGLPPKREFPVLKVAGGKPYKVLQVAGIHS